MAAELGSDVIILHPPRDSTPALFRQSLDELQPFARQHHVRIALENGDLTDIAAVLSEYPPDYLGLCYDCGHGNKIEDGLDRLEELKDRLISVHLHDNDGASDQHKPLFSGTVDWPRLAQIMAGSAYTKCVSMEAVMRHSGLDDEAAFLDHAFVTGMRFTRMIEAERRSGGNLSCS